MSSGKLILLLIAIVMIGLVLLLGYKLDKYEEKGKRKEKIGKKQVNKENENFYTNFKSLKNDYEDEMNQTTSFGNTSFDRIISKNDKYTEEFDKTAVIEKIDLSKLEMTEDVEEKSNEKVYEELEIENNFEEFEEEMYEEFEEDEAYDYEKSNSSTMVFDTTNVNEELISTVKGYDFEETEVDEEEKPKTARKTVAKKTTTKKTTTKKTETKPKTTRKSTTKKVEEKPKTVRKTATKKTTTKKAEEKSKTTRKVTAKKTDEKENKTKTAAKIATTKKAVKSTKTNAKK